MIDDLSADRVSAALTTLRFGRLYEAHGVCGSTNDLAAQRAREGAPEGLLVTADAQTGGRGRQGRSWHSPAGESLYFSLLLRPTGPPAALPPLTLLVGTVIAQVLESYGLRPVLKWPNDVQLERAGQVQKVAGILVEMASDRDRVRHVVVGVGLNVNNDVFPGELAERATSLALATGRTHARGQLLAAICNALEPAYDRLRREGPAVCLETWRQLARLPRPCRVQHHGDVLEGVAVDLDEEGALLVRDGRGGLVRVLSGEVL